VLGLILLHGRLQELRVAQKPNVAEAKIMDTSKFVLVSVKVVRCKWQCQVKTTLRWPSDGGNQRMDLGTRAFQALRWDMLVEFICFERVDGPGSESL
jgi:hypothetical protein